MATKSTDTIINTVGEWYAKLPNLPKGGRDGLVTITPWVALIFGVLGILVGVSGLGVLTFLSPFAMMGGGASALGNGLLSAVLLLVSSVLLLMAYPGTKAHKAGGWNLLFWSETVALLSSILAFNFVGVLGDLIVFYLIFQIRSYYK